MSNQPENNPSLNRIIQGDCIEAMRRMPERSVNFILTDPPYIANYKARDGRTVASDDNASWLAPSAAQMHRVLKK